VRPGRPLELPLVDGDVEAFARARGGLHRCAQADPQTPLSVLRVAELAGEVGFPPGAINIVPGDGPTTGAYLVRHPGVDKVAFTGSTRTGGEIIRLCSEPIKRVSLELGGKSPNLVFADADLDDAIPSAVWSICYAAGQSCEARSRVLVEETVYDEFVSRFADYAKQIRVGDPLDPETQVGSPISAAHRDRVHAYDSGSEQSERAPADVDVGVRSSGRRRWHVALELGGGAARVRAQLLGLDRRAARVAGLGALA
jgi:acyl-CoA reductase-like NAD-dependent aldehyde dehydrogenase